MKAVEVLNRYAKGERDFRRANLQGQNLKGQDLSGANFSEADIRGTNFSNAILKETNFTRAQAGIQTCWWWAQQTLTFLLSVLAGFLSALSGAVIASLLSDNSLYRVAYFITGVVTLGLMIVVFGAIARQGFTAKAFGTFALAVAVAIAVVIAVAVAVPYTPAGTFALALAIVTAIAVPVAFTGAVASTFALALACTFAITGVFTGAVAGVFAGTFALAFTFTFTGAGDFALGIAPVIAGAGAGAGASLLLAIYCSRRAVKGDEKFARLRVFSVAFGVLGGTSFCGADLTHANFRHTLLKGANFNHTKQRQTILEWVNWQDAKCLGRARVGNSMLANPAVQDLLVTRNGSHKSYIDANLRATDLNGVKLEGANLTWADLSCAKLRQADLQGANLTEAIIVGTDLTGAQLTGACLEDWNISSYTKLEDVDCQYVYLLRNQQERRPNSGDFAPGEFTKLFQEVLNTVDLIFRNGVDWKAFVSAFKQVQVENQDTPLEIQSIENKGDGVIVVRVNVPPETDKAKIHSEFNQQYELALKTLEAKYQAELKAKEGEIAIYREQSANMWAAINSLASRPVNIINENTLMKNSTDQSQNVTIGGNVMGSTINLGEISASVSNVVNQLSSSPDPDQPGLKELLTQLQATIETADELLPEDKADGLEQVKVLAELGQNPQTPNKEGIWRKAWKILNAPIPGLTETATIVKSFSEILPAIAKILGVM